MSSPYRVIPNCGKLKPVLPKGCKVTDNLTSRSGGGGEKADDSDKKKKKDKEAGDDDDGSE